MLFHPFKQRRQLLVPAGRRSPVHLDRPGILILNAFGQGFQSGIDAGQGLSEHASPFDAVVHILDGEAKITIGGKPHTVKAGEIIIMPANIPHALQAEVQFKMLLVLIRGK